MNEVILFLVVLLPVIGGILIPLLPYKNRKQMMVYIEVIVLLTSAAAFYMLFHRPSRGFTLIYFTGNLTIRFHLDGLGCVFVGLLASLWPLATLYAFEYMTKERHEKIFFMFYTITYGVTLGIALSDNILTLYCFYEMLTLVTLPLVMHTLSREAILASRKYLYYSLGGAAFSFIGMVFIISFGTSSQFLLGGVMDPVKIGNRQDLLYLVYVLTFFGFGVKAAVCPFNSWLPDAGVAPTPVTALLHAVAVVKSGAFAIMRVTFYSFGTGFLRGSWAQYVTMAAAVITIVYGCSIALKETHLKRRLAYSTISNLSYILFGVTIMTPLGLVGALCHLIFHAVIKICAFFCAGAVIHQTERNYINELDGLGRKMPKVFIVFTISGLALMGVPGLCGFISKWNLAKAALSSGNMLAVAGIGCLLVSAILTAIYMMSTSVRAFFPGKDFDYSTLKDARDPNWMLLLPLVLFVIAMVIFGLHSAPLVSWFTDIANGVFK
ncbi:MAG: proton-conducting transporter membrane subunit [Lachnospiraceae bacterium]|nr:proton-conducting transporter membrane subunit [Lachnospiraceae bacterium]